MSRKTSYHTKHKAELLTYLQSTSGCHHTAAQIRDYFLASGSPVGIATIYRILDSLVQEGLVHKYTLESCAGFCYEYPDNRENHFHCECIRCGALIRLNCEELLGIQKHLQKDHRFMWDSGKTVFYGICGDCQK